MSRKARNTEQEKPKTKYDRKMEARRKQAAKEKRETILFRSICLVILAGLVGTAGYFGVNAYMDFHTATTEAYITVGEHDITKLEYDYYFNSTVNNYTNTYSYFLSYMGLDTSQPLDEQQFSEDMTWQEYFEQMTLEQLKQEYALLDDAKANNFEYDMTEDYNQFVDTAKEAAENNQISVRNYYKIMFGDYATARNIKPFMETSFIASAYYEKLMEDYAPSEDVVADYYEEHKAEYDTVSYYSFSFDPINYLEDNGTDTSESTPSEDMPEDSENTPSEEDAPEENQSAAYTLAEEMKERLEQGADFETLCMEYASDELKVNYESEDTEYSLTENATCSSVNQAFQAWVSDESRKPGDITMIQAEDTGICYVLKFVTRTYDENCLDTISTTLATEAVEEYMEALLEGNYEVTDLKGEIAYLKTTEEAEDDTDSDTESLLNTSIIE